MCAVSYIDYASGGCYHDGEGQGRGVQEVRGGAWCQFFPFIIETLGAYGKETAKVLKVLAKAVFNSHIDSPRDYLVQCNRVVAVAVQRGNALVARQGAVLSRAAAARSAYAEW